MTAVDARELEQVTAALQSKIDEAAKKKEVLGRKIAERTSHLSALAELRTDNKAAAINTHSILSMCKMFGTPSNKQQLSEAP